MVCAVEKCKYISHFSASNGIGPIQIQHPFHNDSGVTREHQVHSTGRHRYAHLAEDLSASNRAANNKVICRPTLRDRVKRMLACADVSLREALLA